MGRNDRVLRIVAMLAAAILNSVFIVTSHPQHGEMLSLALSLVCVGVALKWPIHGNVVQILSFIVFLLWPGIQVTTFLIVFVALIDLNMRRPAWIGAVGATVVALTFIFAGLSGSSGVSFAFAVAFMASVGAILRSRSDALAQQAELAQLRLVAQRQQIARDMHDVVAYGLSQIVLRSRVAAASELEHPQTAREFAGIAEAARASLTEVRTVISLLNQDGHNGSSRAGTVVPDNPSEQLSESIEQIRHDLRASHFDASVTVSGDVDHLPSRIHFVAARVLKELAANAIRHADPRQVVLLSVAHQAGQLVVESSNAVAPAEHHAAFPSSGVGLQGMAGRLAEVSGTVQSEVVGDQWSIHVVIPTPSSDTPSIAPGPPQAVAEEIDA